MPYTKTTWVDEILDGAERFDIKDNLGTDIETNVQIVLKTSVTTPGTPIDAENLNKIEQGIYDVTEALENATNDSMVILKILSDTETWTTGDGKIYWTVPPEFNGAELISANAYCIAPSSSGTPTVQIARGRRATASSSPTYNDMLSVRMTIDVGEYSSTDAENQPVINPSYDDVETRDVIRIDIDTAGTGTKGLDVSLVFRQ